MDDKAGSLKLDRIIELLEEFLRWRRVISLDQIRSLHESVLNTDKKRDIHALSDGQRTAEEIGNAVGMNVAIVRGYWSEWEAVGIVEPASIIVKNGGLSIPFNGILSNFKAKIAS